MYGGRECCRHAPAAGGGGHGLPAHVLAHPRACLSVYLLARVLARPRLPSRSLQARCCARCVHVSVCAHGQLLESCFLVSASLVLMAGMVFSADGFTRGSTGYNLLTVLVAGVIIVATSSFAALLAFEVYRSVKFAEAHALARRVEEEALEEAVLGKWRRRTPTAGAGAGASAGSSPRRRSSIMAALARGSGSFGRRVSAAVGVSPASPDTGPEGAADSAASGRLSDGSSRTVARRRRESLLARLQGIVGGGTLSGGEAGTGPGGPASNAVSDGMGAQSPIPPRPPPSHTPLSSAPWDGGSTGARPAPCPPPPPPHDDSGSPGHPGRVGVDAVVVAKAAARSLRVRNMVAKERTPTA
jgi:hypothetical protein